MGGLIKFQTKKHTRDFLANFGTRLDHESRMKSENKQFMNAISLAGFLILLSFAASACPNCKNALPDSDNPETAVRLSEGYFWSYVAMSTMPFVAIGTIAGIVFLRRKNSN